MDLADTPRTRRRTRAIQSVLARAAREPDTTARYATAPGWRLLAGTGLLDVSTVDVAAAEAVGAALPDSPYPDTLLATDLLTAAGAADLAAQLRTGHQGAALAMDERLAAAPGSITGTITGTSTANGGPFSGVLRHVRHTSRADVLVVPTVRPPAAGEFLILVVPVGTSGLTITGGPAGQVHFERVQPVTTYPLEPHHWPTILAAARVRLAAHLIGIAAAALDVAERHVVRRRQFGQPLAAFQGVSFPLAAAAAKLEAARMLAHYTASTVDRPLANEETTRMAAQALATAARTARTTTAAALHAHGSIGLTDHTPVADLYLHARNHSGRLGTPAALDRVAGAVIAAHDRVPHRFFGEGD